MITSTGRAARVGLLTFIISLVVSILFQISLVPWASVVLLLIVVLAGIIFDIIGTAVTAAKESPFHAMGADKVRGSRQAVLLIRNADRVANFCNDVIGDISGTISGAIIAGIVLEFTGRKIFLPKDLVNATAIAIVAAVTVGGKALGKSFAIEKANQIVFSVGKFLSFVKFINLESKRNKRKGKSNSRKGRKS